MPDPRCPACASLLRWTGIRYYCTKCKRFPDPLASGVPEPGHHTFPQETPR